MAKIHEEILIIKVSSLIREDQDAAQGTLITSENIAALEQIVQELAPAGAVVEIDQA